MIVHSLVLGADDFTAVAARYGISVAERLDEAVRISGRKLRAIVMANASNRPGPNVITGQYRQSISVRYERSKNGASAFVGTDAPQGRRLELGFVGVDSIGRHYNQPPFPHWRPGIAAVMPIFEDLVRLATAEER